MKTSCIVFSILFSILLVVSVLPESEAFDGLLNVIGESKGLRKKVLKKLIYYFLIAGNRKIYAVPFPLPLPIPILKKLQPIIYKEQVPVYEPPSYGGEYGGY